MGMRFFGRRLCVVLSLLPFGLGTYVQNSLAQTLSIDRKMTMAQLRGHMAGRLSAIPHVTSVNRHSANQLDIKTKDNRQFVIGLDNLLDDVNGKVNEAENTVAEFLAAISSLTSPEASKAVMTAAEFSAGLLPVIENKSFIADFKKELGQSSASMLAKPMAGDIVSSVALDRQVGIKFMQSGDGKEFSFSDEDLFAHARTNLLAKMSLLRQREVGPVKLIDYNSDFNASLMVIDEVWSFVAPGQEDDVVVAVPSRDMLVFGFASDPAAVQALRKIAALPDRAYPVSKQLFRRSGKGWVVFK
jgi:hypothetical protein